MIQSGLKEANTKEIPAPATVIPAATVPRPRPRRLEQSLREPLAFRPRPWVGVVMLIGDMAVLELALFLGWLTRMPLTPWLGGALRKGQYQALAIGMLVSISMGFLGGLLPALSAIRLRPLAALR